MTNLAIEVNGLCKSYRDKTGDKVVLDDIDLPVRYGEPARAAQVGRRAAGCRTGDHL